MQTTPPQHDVFAYAFQEIADQETVALLEETPARWGRMPPLARLLVVETGRFLRENKLLAKGRNLAHTGKNVGLIGGTSRGSLTTDLGFAKTLQQGPELASPALFGYTLANIPLAEAANHYGLTGPVYAVIDEDDPFQSACREARHHLATSATTDYILACRFDDLGAGTDQPLRITFGLIQHTHAH